MLERIIRVLIFCTKHFSSTAGDDSSTNEDESQHFSINFTSTVVFKLTVPSSMHHTITINMKLTKKARWCTIIGCEKMYT